MFSDHRAWHPAMDSGPNRTGIVSSAYHCISQRQKGFIDVPSLKSNFPAHAVPQAQAGADETKIHLADPVSGFQPGPFRTEDSSSMQVKN